MARRQLGRYLRDLRGRARFSVRAASQEFEWSETKMWRIESGLTSMRSHEVKMMCQFYGAPVETTTALMALAKETKANGWWMRYSDVIPETSTSTSVSKKRRESLTATGQMWCQGCSRQSGTPAS
ncbi:Helix-turn-helix domain-containing protein [Actinokineospora iranica]|uniref:Helix-turn-helix domain-containing protein n=1 Tax=Actinokineospora iranica TaxID=1271860 RepID=A0A1G6WDV0_9PSEU|nr:Helix-turn-helix domain-containing protein [Actinokineospora iranica]